MAVFWKKQPQQDDDTEARTAQPVASSKIEKVEVETSKTSPRRQRFRWVKRSGKSSDVIFEDVPHQDQTTHEAVTSGEKSSQLHPKWQVWRRRSKSASQDARDEVFSTSQTFPENVVEKSVEDFVEDSADSFVEDLSDVPSAKRRWWRRKQPHLVSPDELDGYAALEHQISMDDAAYVEPELPEDARPLNPDGSLPPDLKAEFAAHDAPQNTQRVFNRFLQRVETKSPEELEQTAAEVDGKLDRMNRGNLAKVWQKVEMLARVVRDPKSHWPSKLMALASLVYVVSPIDAIPDILPALGLADDVAVVITIVGYLAQAVDYAKKVPQELEQQTDREIKKHIHKNRISLVYAAAAAVLVFLAAWAINTFVR